MLHFGTFLSVESERKMIILFSALQFVDFLSLWGDQALRILTKFVEKTTLALLRINGRKIVWSRHRVESEVWRIRKIILVRLNSLLEAIVGDF